MDDKFESLFDAGLETFKVEEISRTQLNNAVYNPRFINDKEKSKLKSALKKHGLVAPITWNKRTGNIVGGHQRINIMDSLMKSKDYKLSVAVIDVPENKEKELNILLNNQQAMGSWDMAELKNIFKDETVSLEGSGFDLSDMIHMFGDDSLNERQEDLAELASRLSEMSALYSGVQTKNSKKLSQEFFLVLVFPDSEHIDALLTKYKLPDNRYQNGKFFCDLLDVKVEPQE